MPNADLTIGITHYRSVGDLLCCIHTLKEIGYEDQIIVADSEAQPSTREVLSSLFPAVSYIPFVHNVGYSVLVNAIGQQVTTKNLLILNADTRVTEAAIMDMVEQMDSDPSIGAIGPRLQYLDGEDQDSAFAFYRPSTVLYRRTGLARLSWGRKELNRFTAPSRDTAQRALDVDWVLGAVMLFRAEAFREVGGFDSSYFLYFEDVDICLRLWKSGWRVVYLPQTTCLHSLSRGSAGGGPLALVRNRLTRTHLKSAIRFFLKHGARPSRGDFLAVRGQAGGRVDVC